MADTPTTPGGAGSCSLFRFTYPLAAPGANARIQRCGNAGGAAPGVGRSLGWRTGSCYG